MMTKSFWYRIGTISLLVAGLFTTAAAQRNRNWDGYPNWGGSYDLRQTALNAGFNEGTRQGRDDRSHNRYRNFDEFSAYRDATKDYSSRLGDRDLYRRYYQIAFEHGYDAENPNGNGRNGNYDRNRDYDRNRNDNRDRDYDRNRDNRNDNRDRDRDRNDNRGWGREWNRYGQYGGSFQLRQTALNAGYNAGIREGRNDRRRNRQRSYNDFADYRNATTDYSSRLGDRELYRRYYREGFQHGYEDGWNGY